MSVLELRTLTCPHCGTESEREVAVSVDGSRSSEDRAAILAGRFQVYTCRGCDTASTADGPLVYLDLERRHFIGCYPRAWELSWRNLEHEPRDTWRRTVVDHAPAAVRKSADGYFVRAVFGLPMLREKLLCLDSDIDDRLVEALKFDLMRSGQLAMHPMARPVLTEVGSEDLVFAGQVVADGEHTSEGAALGVTIEPEPDWRVVHFVVPRARLTELHDARTEWRDFWREMSMSPYVDTGRLLIAGTGVRPE